MIASNLDMTMARVREKAGSGAATGGWLTALLDVVEGFLEPGDSVKRRKTADRIYKDVVTERISSKRAVAELQTLTQRQKGGWLARAVESLRRKTTEGAPAVRQPEREEETVRV